MGERLVKRFHFESTGTGCTGMSQVIFETMTALMSIFLLGDLTAKILKLEMYSVGLSCDMPSMLKLACSVWHAEGKDVPKQIRLMMRCHEGLGL